MSPVRRSAVNLPVQPLLQLLGNLPHLRAAPLLGVTHRQLCRWLRHGVPITSADNVAVAAGYHPLEVWGQAWIDAERIHEDDTDEGWAELFRRWSQWDSQCDRLSGAS